MKVRLCLVMWELILNHVRNDAIRDREACGLLTGPAWEVDPFMIDGMRHLDNVSEHPRWRYETDPDELLHAWNAVENIGRKVVGIYHSHLDGTTALSPTDIRYALDPALVHLVIGWGGPHGPVMDAWRVVGGRVEHVPLEPIAAEAAG